MTQSNRILVTGATSGIGFAVASALLAEGRSVVAVGRHFQKVHELSARYPGRVEMLHAALEDSGDARFVVQRALKTGPLHGFVSAAGFAHHELMGAISERSFREQFEVNTFAPMRIGEELVAKLEVGSAMVFLTSTLAHRPVPTSYVYSATKAALLSAVKSLALAGAPRMVRVNAVSPGVVDTPMARAPRPGESGEEVIAARMTALGKLHALGRVGAATEVADAVLYLLSAPWTTGSELVVDGGLLLA